MKVYFEWNDENNIRESYQLFENKVIDLLNNINATEKDIRKIKNAISDGTKLQAFENHILEIEVSYLEVLHNIMIIWTFPIAEETLQVTKVVEIANDILRNKHLEDARAIYKEFIIDEIKEEHKNVPNRLDGFRTKLTPFHLCRKVGTPIHITKGNIKIDFKQYYQLDK